MGMDKDQISAEAMHLEIEAKKNPENFAKTWEKEEKDLQLSSADMKKIQQKIEVDQKNDTSGALPHIEFYDGGAVKSVDATVHNNPSWQRSWDTQLRVHLEFDRSTHHWTVIDTVDDKTVKTHETFDREGFPLQYDRTEAKTGSTERIVYDAKTHKEVLRTIHVPGTYDYRLEMDAKTGYKIKEEEDTADKHVVTKYKKGSKVQSTF